MKDLTRTPNKTTENAVLYLPGPPGAAEGTTTMVVRARGDAATLPATVGRVGAEADPTMRLYDVRPLTQSHREDMVALVATVAVALFIAGVTALACVGPARRALRIQPTVALRAE